MPLDQIELDEKYEVKKEAEMSFWEHIEVLRWHLIRSIVVFIILTLVVFANKDFVFNQIIYGPKQSSFITFKVMCRLGEWLHMPSLCYTPKEWKTVTIALSEAFFVHMQVSIIIGFILSFPYIFWEFWRFIKPGLFHAEVKAARGFVGICTFLFMLGVLFGYFVVSPFAVSFLATYDLPDNQAMNSLGSYIDFISMLTLPLGIIFELPVVIYFLSKIGIVTPTFLRAYRRHTVVIILIVAGIITPSPDIFSQLMVAVPLYGLYEISILVSARVVKKRMELEAS
jgi:sec-independent protein translocase protein TatC